MNWFCAVMAEGSFEEEEAERAFLCFVCDLFDDAVALMVQPRVDKPATAMEFAMLALGPPMLEALASPEHRVWREQILRAQARLNQSAELVKRGLRNDQAARLQAVLQAGRVRLTREREAAAASGQLKSCALAGCAATEAHISHFGKCSACKAVVYCCREHQQADWPAHKTACKALRKAAAAAMDAA
jgi:hypothetical protein